MWRVTIKASMKTTEMRYNTDNKTREAVTIAMWVFFFSPPNTGDRVAIKVEDEFFIGSVDGLADATEAAFTSFLLFCSMS